MAKRQQSQSKTHLAYVKKGCSSEQLAFRRACMDFRLASRSTCTSAVLRGCKEW